MAKETDYQRARRQRSEVKKHGITGSTPSDASKRIKEHSQAKQNALDNKKDVVYKGASGKKYKVGERKYVKGGAFNSDRFDGYSWDEKAYERYQKDK